ncbi:unnamed protein product [Urochloa decumbens]|uniref:BTB domain-containing protein n=1 Tax=Urochloa decumbens TaxID=240449 RepID=A0ABC9C0Z9_9POAL
MQDSAGKFVEISIAVVPGAGACTVVSKEIAFDDHSWTVHCYPRGAPGEPGAGGYLSIHLVNHTNVRNAKVLFQAIVLCRATDMAGAGVAPPRDNYHASSVFEYPAEGSRRFPWPRVVGVRDLHDRYAVGGYATVVCGLAVLRHNPIPAPPSTYAADLAGLLEARKKFGEPDAAFAVGGRTFDVVRSVLAARSSVLKAELDSAAGDMPTTPAAMPTIRPEHGFSAATFCALLLYVYCDRLPRGAEVGCAVTTELVGELLAAAEWYALGRLKLLCARRLWDGLCVANVSRTLRYAVKCRCPELRSACIDFLTVGHNLKEAFPTEDFGWLMKNSPEVYEEIKRRFEAKNGGGGALAAAGRDDNAVVCTTTSSSGQSSLSG